jgi:hypothetical protein
MYRPLSQTHIALIDGFQLSYKVSKKGGLRLYFQGERLFEAFGEFHKIKPFPRNPESPTQIPAEGHHLRFEYAESGIEFLFGFVAFQDGFHAALHEQSRFSPRVFDELTVEAYLVPNNSQEFRNLIAHDSDPEINEVGRHGVVLSLCFVRRHTVFGFFGQFRSEGSLFARLITIQPVFLRNPLENWRNDKI